MRSIIHSLVLLLALGGLAFPQSVPIKVKIDANRSNEERLLKALNTRGEKYRMKFSQVETGYDYRVAFGLGRTPRTVVTGSATGVTGGMFEYDTGFVIVYDDADHELFRFKHEAWWNESGAISGTAKHIVRRLDTWRREHPKASAAESADK